MTTPRWQRARLQCPADDCPWARGRELWVRVGPPRKIRSHNRFGQRLLDAERYVTNLTADGGCDVVMDAADVELLSQFAEDVPLWTEADWSQPDWREPLAELGEASHG